MTNSARRLLKNLESLAARKRDERIMGTLGKGENFTIIQAPRKNHVWVTPDGSTPVQIANTGKGQVPLRAGLRVKMLRQYNGRLVLDGYDDAIMGDDSHLPDAYGNNPHPLGSHTDVSITAPASGDLLQYDGTDWANAATIPTPLAATIHAATSKTTPVDADELGLVDSAASNILKKLTWANTKATLKTYFDTIYTFANIVTDNSITNAKLRDSGALSVIGRSANSTGDPADISASAASGAVLRESGSALGFGRVATVGIDDDAVTNAKKANMAANTMTSNITGSTADPADNDIATVLAQYIHAATGKTTPIDADELALIDSAASNVLKKLTWVNLKATIKTYLDTLYLALAGGTMAGNINMGTNSITNMANPSSAQDAATKTYADQLVNVLDWKASVRVATTANITLSGTQTIDGVSVIANDRVLVKNQSTGAENGIYVCAAGAWSRATDADGATEVTAGMAVFVEEGTTNADTGWVLTTNNAITVGSTSLSFAQFTVKVNSVDNATLAQMAANTVKSNITGSTANAADNDIATVLAQYIHAATSKATPVDNDELALIDSAASNVLKKLTWANLKTTLRTAFDLVYGLLDTANTWTKNNQFNTTSTSGVGLGVTRNLTSTSTDSAVVEIINDHASDDQPALNIREDAANVAANIERVVSTTNTIASVVFVELTSTGNMVDGHGPAVTFRIKDDANTDNTIGVFGATRDGADNTGKFVIRLANAGSVATYFSVNASGLGILGNLSSVGANILAIVAGTSSNDAAVGGLLYEDHAVTGQVGAGPDTLSTYSIPANTLAVNGQSIHWCAGGTITTAGGTGTIKVVYGSTTILNMPGSAVSGGQWRAEGDIIRTGATAQRAISTGTIVVDSSTPQTSTWINDTTPAETLSGAVTLKVTGESSSNNNNDTVSHMLKVYFEDANT